MTTRLRVDPAIDAALTDRGPVLIRAALDEAAASDTAMEEALFALGVAVGAGRHVRLIDSALEWAAAQPRGGRASVIPLVRGAWHTAGRTAGQVRRLKALFEGADAQTQSMLDAAFATHP